MEESPRGFQRPYATHIIKKKTNTFNSENIFENKCSIIKGWRWRPNLRTPLPICCQNYKEDIFHLIIMDQLNYKTSNSHQGIDQKNKN